MCILTEREISRIVFLILTIYMEVFNKKDFNKKFY